MHIARSRARRSPAYRDGTSAARAAALRRVASVGRDLRTASAGGCGPNTLAVQSIGGLSIGGQPAGQRSTVSIPSQHAAADGRTGPPAGSLAALELWRSMLGGTPELGFTELAQLLCDRPRPARRVLDAAADAAQRSTGADRVPAFSHALLESVVAAERVVAHFQARAAADLAELADSYPGLREHLATEIALALGCSEGTATRRLDEAEQTARRLPGTVSARWRGLLPTPKVTALRVETENVSEEVAAQVEADVLAAAPGQSVPELRTAIRQAILRRDPDGATTRHRSASSRRRVSRWSLPDGMAGLQVISSATDIAAIHDCIAAVADLAKTPGEIRVTDQRRVDALLDICTDILESGRFGGSCLPRQHRRRPQVQVTMPLDAVLGADVPCDLRGHGPITADQARRIAADGELRRLVCDPLSGTLLDYGRRTYQPPPQLADHVLARDRTCTAPGCRQPAARCEIDHTIPFPHGPTSADNLAVLCKHHHRAKDGGGFTVRRHTDGWTTWSTPMGTTVSTPPRRLWHPPRPGQPQPTDPAYSAGHQHADGEPTSRTQPATPSTPTPPAHQDLSTTPNTTTPDTATPDNASDEPPF